MFIKVKTLKNVYVVVVMTIFLSSLIFSNTVAAEDKPIIDRCIIDGIADNLSTINNYLIINNENIYTSDKTWNQPDGYEWYRIHITNARNEVMKMTIRFSEHKVTYEVPAKSSKTYTAMNALPVNHTLSFTTASGIVEGKVNVRVSDTEL